MAVDVWQDRDPSVTIEPFERAGAFVVVYGALDVSVAGLLGDAVQSAIEADYTQLVIDLNGATFFDSGSFRVLVESVEPLGENEDAAVVLVSADGSVRRVLELVEADLLFPCYADRDTARRSLRLPPSTAEWRHPVGETS
jgi:anti-anti-sigma factor